MNYHNITHDDMLNGDGLRVVLWVAGCSHHCKNCQNPITWDPDGGIPFDSLARKEIFEQLEKDYNAGITFSGGDPLHGANLKEVTALAKEIRSCYPKKTIWLYTGYLWEEVRDLEIISYIDVLVDGKYDKKKRDTKLHWIGSRNKRIIDVRRSTRSGKVILYEVE